MFKFRARHLWITLLLTHILSLFPTPAQAQITWAFRSTTLEAYHANALKVMTRMKSSTAVTFTAGPSGTFGGTYLDVNTAPTSPQIEVPGLHNTPIGTSAITILWRLIPRASGNPAAKKALLYMGNLACRSDGWCGGLAFNVDSNGQFEIDGGTIASGSNWGNDSEIAALTFVADQPTDIWFVWDGSTSANSQKLYQAQNGNAPTLIGSRTPSAARPSMQLGWVTAMQLNGNMPNGTNYNDQFHINEIVIWDTAEDPTSYGARTDFIPTTSFEGYTYTDPGVANVRSGTAYTYNGSAKTGTAAIPTAANTKTGVAVDATTGTYTGSDRWTCPTAGQLSNGVALKCDSTSTNLTGTLTSVTNVLSTKTMTGADRNGTLRAQ